jgi:hypothetical protein
LSAVREVAAVALPCKLPRLARLEVQAALAAAVVVAVAVAAIRALEARVVLAGMAIAS